MPIYLNVPIDIYDYIVQYLLFCAHWKSGLGVDEDLDPKVWIILRLLNQCDHTLALEHNFFNPLIVGLVLGHRAIHSESWCKRNMHTLIRLPKRRVYSFKIPILPSRSAIAI